MLTDTDRALLHACRAKRYALTKAQIATKVITRAPHPPEGCGEAQAAQNVQAADITALHIMEAEIRGLKPAHSEKLWSVQLRLLNYRSPHPEVKARFQAWLMA